MRGGAILTIVSLLATGCAAQKPVSRTEAIPAPRYLPAATGALVFDPPVTQGQPPVDLSRDGRGEGAFVGFETITATTFYLETNDRQASDWHSGWGDRYDRRAISTKVGVSYR